MKKLLLTCAAALLAMPSMFASNVGNLYLIGAGVQGNTGGSESWALGTNQMTYDSATDTYTWTGKELKNEFKINDGSWSGTYNLGATNKGLLTLGQPYTATNGSSDNINFAGDVTSVINPTVKLQTNGQTFTITVTGQEDDSVEISLAGSFNGNNANDATYNLKEGSNQTFTGTFSFDAGAFTFQVIVNHSSWLGYANEDQKNVTFTGTNPVKLNLGSGYQNDFTVTSWNGGTIDFTVDYPAQTVTLVAHENSEVTYPTTLYMIGQANGNDWNENEGIEQSGSNGLFEFKNVVISNDGAGTGSFAFTTTIGNWDLINAGRYAPETADQEIAAGDTQTMVKGEDRSWVIAAGTYDFTVDLVNMELSVEGTADPYELKLYIMGNGINGEGMWEASDANLMTYDEASDIYTWTGTKLEGKFKFNNGAWDKGYNIGAGEVTTITVGTPLEVFNNSESGDINLPDDCYVENPVVTLDLNAMTVLVEGTVVNTAPYVPEVIYFKGSFDDWSTGVALNPGVDGLYTGSVNIPEQESALEFKLDCGNDKWYGFFNSEESMIYLTEGVETNLGMSSDGGNWTILGWEGGSLTITVDWELKVLTLVSGPATEEPTDGVSSIDADNAPAAIYNLQGVRVNGNNLPNGIYIVNGKKVVVRK